MALDPAVAELASLAATVRIILDGINSRPEVTDSAIRITQRAIIQFAIDDMQRRAGHEHKIYSLEEMKTFQISIGDMQNEEQDAADAAASMQQAVDFVNAKGGAVDQAITNLHDAMAKGPHVQRMENLMLMLLKETVIKSGKEPLKNVVDMKLDIGTPRKQVTPQSNCVIFFTNHSGKTLHNAVFMVDVNIDQDIVDKSEKYEDKQSSLAGLVESGLGVDPALSAKQRDTAKLRWEILRLGFGHVAYLPEWPDGKSVRLVLDQAGNLNSYAQDVEALIGCDEGCQALTPLTQAEIRDQIKQRRAAQPTPPQQAPARKRRANGN
jgi:hypothetical protein